MQRRDISRTRKGKMRVPSCLKSAISCLYLINISNCSIGHWFLHYLSVRIFFSLSINFDDQCNGAIIDYEIGRWETILLTTFNFLTTLLFFIIWNCLLIHYFTYELLYLYIQSIKIIEDISILNIHNSFSNTWGIL